MTKTLIAVLLVLSMTLPFALSTPANACGFSCYTAAQKWAYCHRRPTSVVCRNR